jgi:transketolase
VEHLASLRIIPNLRVLRPADAQETALAWTMALERNDGPTVLALTRQNLEVFPKADGDWRNTAQKGAYIVKDCDGTPDVILAASGSEVNLVLAAAALCPEKKIRVVSVLSLELFLSQGKAFRQGLIPEGVRTITAEVGVRTGWESLASSSEDMVSLDRFGISGPGEQVAAKLGFTPERIAEMIGK